MGVSNHQAHDLLVSLFYLIKNSLLDPLLHLSEGVREDKSKDHHAATLFHFISHTVNLRDVQVFNYKFTKSSSSILNNERVPSTRDMSIKLFAAVCVHDVME